MQNNPAIRMQGEGGKRSPTRIGMVGYTREDFDSAAEWRHYNNRILPAIETGRIITCKIHETFTVVPPVEHRGQKHKQREYTPDFYLQYADGAIEVGEIKGQKVKKLQRDYPIRRQLFLLNHCVPNGWRFIEIMDYQV